MAIRNSELILKTFDGSMKELKVQSQQKETKVEFEISYYDNNDNLTDAILTFDEVIVIDFQVNYFHGWMGLELDGFYEIFETSYKTELIEKVFENRRNAYLYKGNYIYDAEDENDSLNYRTHINDLIKCIDSYHLYQQETQGGIFQLLAKGYTLLDK